MCIGEGTVNMLITRFNSLIRNRVVWIAFAGIVSASFLGFSMAPGGCEAQGTRAVGTLNAREVSPEEFRMAMFFEMGLSEPRGLDRAQHEQLRRQTWRRIAILDKAAELGLVTSDQEIAQLVGREQEFLVNGSFDRGRYDAFVRSRGVNIPIFESYLRQNLTIQKAITALESLVWTPPSDVNRRLRNLIDERRVGFVILPIETYTGTVNLTREDILAFYEERPEFFRIPERVRVKYVHFPHANYRPEEIDEAMIADYYDLHRDEFLPEGMDPLALPEPLETVRPVIVERLRDEEARFQARDAATEFVIALAPDRRGGRPSFDQLATTQGLTVATTDWFAVDEAVPSLDVDLEFRQAAFGLVENDPELAFSDAINGADAAYVLYAFERAPSRIPPFEEIADEIVTPLATSNALQRAFLAWANDLRDQLETQTLAGTPGNLAATKMGLDVIMTGAFSVLDSLSTNLFEYADIVIPGTVELEAGEWGEVLTAPEVALIPFMIERLAGDPAAMTALRPQLISSLQEFQGGLLFREWGEYLLREGQLKDLQAQSVLDEDTGELD